MKVKVVGEGAGGQLQSAFSALSEACKCLQCLQVTCVCNYPTAAADAFFPAALQAQLPADAVAALQAATAASVEQQLQRYHAHMLDAQQQLLARECGSDTQHGSQVCQVTGGSSLAPAGVSCAGAAVGGSAGSGLGAAAATGDSKSAEFTMQQLVARLAKRDVQREDTTKGTEGPR